jgi:FtsZ-binding cell division protein ZapB
MADKIHDLKEKLQQLQSEVVDIATKKSVAKEELKDLHNEIEAAQERLNSADTKARKLFGETQGRSRLSRT